MTKDHKYPTQVKEAAWIRALRQMYREDLTGFVNRHLARTIREMEARHGIDNPQRTDRDVHLRTARTAA